MKKRGDGDGLRHATTGLLMMAAGVVLLLDQQGMIEIGSVGRWWPLVFVVMGLWKLTAPRGSRDAGGGIELIFWGAWLVATLHHWMGLTFRNSWPLIFVGIGVKMIVQALTPARPTPAAAGTKEDGHA